MQVTTPGVHPSFRLDKFTVEEQRILRRLSQVFHLTSDGEITIGETSRYRYALIKPSDSISGIVHSTREMMLVFSGYQDFQPRTLDAFDRVLSGSSDEFRIEKVVRVLLSADDGVSKKLRTFLQSKPDAPVVVPFSMSEIKYSTTDQDILARFREFTFSRDLFSMSSPLRGDLYFYGRSQLINEISAKLASGENFGLFGLRRSGKTSIANGVSRALLARNLISVNLDCQSPAIHKRRWNELLRYIAVRIKDERRLTVKIHDEAAYSEIDAADSFLRDMRAIRKKTGTDSLVLIFDEIERISFSTASSEHWKDGGDFLSFWQALRYGFQSEDAPYTYLLVGTNPGAVEVAKILDSDNPLFGNLEKRYIPMFGKDTVEEMIGDLGRIMGVTFGPDAMHRLFEDFGGHPFLTRHAASYVAATNVARPIEIDRTSYAKGSAKFSADSDQYIGSVVDLLEDHYQEEFELLKALAHDDMENFRYFASADPNLVQHLIGYGIVEKGSTDHFFRIGAVERYFENIDKAAHLVSKEDRWREIGERRNSLEQLLREIVLRVFSVAFHKNERRQKILSKIRSKRSDAMADYSYEALLDNKTCPLYFNEITSVIAGYWDNFGNILGTDKPTFQHHAATINRYRKDAHAKSVSDSELDEIRVSLRAMETIAKQD